MGRKKKGTTVEKLYFGENEELAVLEFLYGEGEEREKVFRETLYKPLNTMVESIIKRYRLMRDDISIEDLVNDTLSFLITKSDKFKPEENAKAYSYYGTICRNYLMGQLKKRNKLRNHNISYEDISASLEEDSRFSYEIEVETKIEPVEFIVIISQTIKDEINDNKKLKPNEVKVGYALIDILDNWQSIVSQDEKSNILARNKVLYEIRENTFLNSKEVRSALKKYKKLYNILKKTIF